MGRPVGPDLGPDSLSRHLSLRIRGRAAALPATRRAFQPSSEPTDLIGQAVQAALTAHAGDVEAATAALVKKAIPDAMALMDETRKGGRATPTGPDALTDAPPEPGASFPARFARRLSSWPAACEPAATDSAAPRIVSGGWQHGRLDLSLFPGGMGRPRM